MAWYFDGFRVNGLQPSSSMAGAWKAQLLPGQQVPASGIYGCTLCQREVTCHHHDTLPAPGDHQHSTGDARWKLLVMTNPIGV